ncbi:MULTISPECIES: NVEALA domain-containing protein [Bacteroidales]|jgi:hypothetical protein|uniref:NVEALA domain-containing protein n=1 Tax=Bacteroidales TaxID=171549 RepID=UPI00244DAE7E|nr:MULTISPECIES: NVEALA domain-containing protein [Bacteroidales]
MKKKIIFAAVAVVMGVSAYVGVNAQQQDAMSDIQLSNVEALVSGESDNGRWNVTKHSNDYWECNAGGTQSCPGTPW